FGYHPVGYYPTVIIRHLVPFYLTHHSFYIITSFCPRIVKFLLHSQNLKDHEKCPSSSTSSKRTPRRRWAENNVPPANRPGMLPMLLPCLKRAKEHRARFHMVNDIERYTDLVFLPKINALIDLLNRTIYFCSPAEAA
ncbi:hypothetical protein PMAYCL1PPCAC_09951, partial [Pristionchus mayeri]